MPQMFPMSWLVIFFSVEFMLMLSFFLMSYIIMINEYLGENIVYNKKKVFWLW
uniref:ATP synthase F0 subunit 8 n=1 Tax=Epanerchodus koreanus TaxID=2678661 RepID=A0A7L8HYY4_9MYRI|nr:ATP synthase F0 subunit 8 [Epanerchodus koreanus]QOE55897.1 ATP synthase F0 subunit 8 [Epanerchodus koreanus]